MCRRLNRARSSSNTQLSFEMFHVNQLEIYMRSFRKKLPDPGDWNISNPKSEAFECRCSSTDRMTEIEWFYEMFFLITKIKVLHFTLYFWSLYSWPRYISCALEAFSSKMSNEQKMNISRSGFDWTSASDREENNREFWKLSYAFLTIPLFRAALHFYGFELSHW